MLLPSAQREKCKSRPCNTKRSRCWKEGLSRNVKILKTQNSIWDKSLLHACVLFLWNTVGNFCELACSWPNSWCNLGVRVLWDIKLLMPGFTYCLGFVTIGPFYRIEIPYCIREHLACVKMEGLYLGKRPRECNQVLNLLCFWRLLALSI